MYGCADFLLCQLFMHVLKIHNVKIDYGALAMAMGNGEFFGLPLFFSRCWKVVFAFLHSGIELLLFFFAKDCLCDSARAFFNHVVLATFPTAPTIHTYPLIQKKKKKNPPRTKPHPPFLPPPQKPHLPIHHTPTNPKTQT